MNADEELHRESEVKPDKRIREMSRKIKPCWN